MVDTIITIGVQPQDFNVAEVHSALTKLSPYPGAVVLFTGLVRDFDNNKTIQALELEHYPGMTEKSLQTIAEHAANRWELQAITVLHRIGRLQAGDQIVVVAVASRHRAQAFQAAEFIMDYLKNDAPFWKKEITPEGDTWVEAKASDQAAKSRWQKNS